MFVFMFMHGYKVFPQDHHSPVKQAHHRRQFFLSMLSEQDNNTVGGFPVQGLIAREADWFWQQKHHCVSGLWTLESGVVLPMRQAIGGIRQERPCRLPR